MSLERTLMVPLAEHFHSIQGEGFWVGTPMHFIRLAGCPVGAKATQKFLDAHKNDSLFLPLLQDNTPASMCQTYDGRFFACDTNFAIHEKMFLEQLIEETYESHICLTGGEPLIHQNSEWWQQLMLRCNSKQIRIHIETSGTIQIKDIAAAWSWITVAPKHGYLQEMVDTADEVKFLVDENFDLEKLPFVTRHKRVFLSPINDENIVNQANVKICLKLLESHPSWRLSAQWHKFLGVR